MSTQVKLLKKSGGGAYVILLVIGIGLLFLSLFDMKNAYTSLKWPTVAGRIVRSEVHVIKDRGTAYCPEISWSYIVQGTIYTDSYDPFCSTNAQAQAKVARFPQGLSVAVSYSPQDPSLSTIEPGSLKYPIYFPIAGILLIGLAIFKI